MLGHTFRRTMASARISKYPQGPLRRFFHGEQAQLLTVAANGEVQERQFKAKVQPGEALVEIPHEIGGVLGAACQESHTSRISDTQPLLYYHHSRSFTPVSAPLPRLTIPQVLPWGGNEATSPATLWLFSDTHMISLDGTKEAEMAQKAYEIWYIWLPHLERGVYHESGTEYEDE